MPIHDNLSVIFHTFIPPYELHPQHIKTKLLLMLTIDRVTIIKPVVLGGISAMCFAIEKQQCGGEL